MRSAASILHVDLDAFYASVEQRDDPTLAGRPVIVGGLGPRGVVAAASYEAREFGVYSATPMVRARRACPDGVFLAPRFDRYRDVSTDVMRILKSYTPLVEPISLDEAFLDVAGARRVLGTGPELAVAIREQVRADTRLTISVGVATTKLLAKLASDLAKPDGLLVVEPGTELEFLHPLPVRRLWGVGPATERKLAALGVQTVGELAAIPEDTLVRALGNASGRHLHALAWNRDERPVVPDQEVKSIGHEETFPSDLHDHAALDHRVVGLADGVASRLRARAGDRPYRAAQGALRRLHHRDPVAHAARAHRPGRRPRAGRPRAPAQARRGPRRPAARHLGPAARAPRPFGLGAGWPFGHGAGWPFGHGAGGPGHAVRRAHQRRGPGRWRWAGPRPGARPAGGARAVGRRGAGPFRSRCRRPRSRE